MKPIDVQEQPQLGFRRTLEISLHGIRHRLFRAAVTMAVIAVAIAFMMNVVCEALAYRAVGGVARRETRDRRLAVHWLAKLTVTPTRESLLAELATVPAGDPLVGELAQQGGLRLGETEIVRQAAVRATEYLAFFEHAGYARKRLLVGAVEGTALFGRLRDPRIFAEFAAELGEQKTLRLPGNGTEGIQAFLATWPGVAKRLDAMVAGRRRACERATVAFAGEPVLQALRRADADTGTALRAAGFPSMSAAIAPAVAAQARAELILRELENSLQQPDLRQRVATRLDIDPHKVTVSTLWSLLRQRDTAAWYLTQLAKFAPLEEPLPPPAIVALARRQTETRAWEDALLLTRDARGDIFGIGTRMAWLVAVSLLVCAVGISNAMLMTVTERFREIATLKCLGALDEFVLQLFLLEACVLGLTGGTVGAVAGSAIGFGRMAVQFGSLLTVAFPWLAWLVGLAVAVLAGIAVAAAAGVYPASVASRLAPLEAMRVE